MATTTTTAPRLAIKVLEARGVGLRNDTDDTAPLAPADIFCQVACGSEAFQTETVVQTTTPAWNQELVFGGDSLKALGERAAFKVFANGDAIGDAFIEIGMLEPDVSKQIVLGLGAGTDGQGTGWTASALDAGVDGAVIPELVIEVLYEPAYVATVLPKLTPTEPAILSPESQADADADAAKPEPVAMAMAVEPEEPAGPQLPPNYIVVTILEAKELVALDGKGENAMSDPFVKIACSKNMPQKTRAIEKTLHPKWRQRFFFYLTHTRQVLDFLMEDSDMFQNDFMGQVSIDLEQWKANFGNEKRVIWLALERSKAEGDTSVSDIGPERHLNYGLGKICIAIEMRHIERDIENLEQGETDHVTVVPSSRNPRVTSGISGVRSLSGQDSGASDAFRDNGDGVPVPDDDDEDKESVTQETIEEIKKRQEERQKMFAELSDVQFLSGDYQVLVRIIEVRDLKPMDVNGLCDPVVSVECMGQRQHTMVKEKQLSCVFDEYLSFNFLNLDKDTVQQSSITITVLDADGPGSSALTRSTSLARLCSDTIGFFAVDIPYVYFQKDHEVHRKWVALVGSGKTNSDSIQGYLLLSIVVLGPGDKLKIHPPHEDRPVDEAPATAVPAKKDINSLVLIPPRVIQTLSYLVVTVHKAIDLPDMDKGVIRQGGVDGYVRVSLAGQDVLETKRVTEKGGGNLTVDFNQELWFPILLPTMSNNIIISLWDWDLTADELVGNASPYLFNMVQKYPNLFKSHWANLYGPPTGYRTEPEARKHMFSVPKAASTYRGRLLLSLRVEDGSKAVHARPHTRNLTIEPPQVPTRSHCLRAAVFFGTEIPRFVSKTSWSRYSKMSLKFSIGSYEVKTTRVENRKGMCYWNQYIDIPDIQLPVDLDQVPDVFIHLVRQQMNETRYICFARFSAKDVFTANVPASLEEIQPIPMPQWVSLIEDQAMNDLKDHDFTGNVLMNLTLEPSPLDTIVKEIAQKWREHAAENLSYTKYTLFVHVFQAKSLPAADTNGVLDPYVKVTCGGAQGKVNMRIATRDPCFYETVSLDIDLPQNKVFLPKVSVQVFDWDQWDTDDYVGAAKFSLTDFPMLTSSEYNKQRAKGEYKPPRPQWYPIARTRVGDTEGELLLSFELIRKETPGIVIDPPESIRPPMEDRFVEITCLGCRGLQPVGFMPINSPFVKFEIGEVSKTNGGVRFTNPSSKPSGRNPNFSERIVVPVKMPLDALYAPRLTISVFDQLLGGFYKPMLGTCSVDLSKKMPLSNGEANPFYVETFGEGFSSNPYVARPTDFSTFPGNLPPSVIEQVSSTASSHDQEETKEEEPPVDRGAGVPPFSASLSVHFPPEEMQDDDELPPYLRRRAILDGPVENEISRPPFESFALFRGDMMVRKKFFGGFVEPDFRSVGKFKGLVRILKHKDEPPLLNLDQFLAPQPYLVRVYVLDALNLQPKDANNKSDPYLRLSLGDGRKRNHLINDRDNYRKSTLKPKFHKMYEFKAQLPGPSDLRVEVLDYDFFALPNIPSGVSTGLTSIGNTVGGDDFIGATIIDLEDRWFSEKWQQLGVNADAYEKRKPLELRPLYAPFSTMPQGNVRLWVDILAEAEMGLCKPLDISLPPSRFFEVRVIVYRARNVTPGDFTDLSDMFVKCWLQNRDDKAQLTDTHWRARDGKGSFNWRMKFDIELPLEEDNEADKGYLHLQLWDKDVLYDDCLADSVVDLGVFLKQAYKTNSVVNVFAKKKEVRVRGTSVSAGGPNASSGSFKQQEPVPAEIHSQGGSSDHHEHEQSTTALVSSQAPSLPRQGRPRSPSYTTPEPAQSTRAKRTTHRHKEKAEILVKSIKARLGMGDDPEDASWLTFTSRDPTTGDRVRAGELLVSVEILPSGVASMRAAGLGRSEPNNFPVLSEPADRLNLSAMWNPLYVMEAVMGPKFYTAFTSGIVCAVIIALIIFAGPLVNAFVTFLDLIPSPWGFVAFGVLLAIVLVSFLYFCYRCRSAIAASEAQQ